MQIFINFLIILRKNTLESVSNMANMVLNPNQDIKDAIKKSSVK